MVQSMSEMLFVRFGSDAEYSWVEYSPNRLMCSDRYGETSARSSGSTFSPLGLKSSQVGASRPTARGGQGVAIGADTVQQSPKWITQNERPLRLVAEDERMDEDDHPQLLRRPRRTAIAASKLVFGGVTAERPGLRIVLAHGGGTFAWALPRIARLWDGHHDHTAAEPPRQSVPLPLDTRCPSRCARRRTGSAVSMPSSSGWARSR
jgi:hypothetical protein